MSENHVSTMMMLRSSFRNSVPLTTAAATVAAVASPPPLPLLPSTLGNTRFLLEHSIISNDNDDNDNDADDDDDDDDDDELSYYDLYESPCRTLIRASNDELDESIIINDEENIISYNSNQMINSGAKLLFDEIEYCRTTFFGGCQYNDLTELMTQINNNDDIDIDIENDEEEEDINIIPSYHSFVNWTVFFDYEIHYIDVSNNERMHHSNDVNENNDALIVINEQRTDITATSASSRTKMKTSEMLRQPQRRRKDQEQQQQQQQQDQYTYHRGDPIPAVEYLEMIVLEHLSEVVGLTRRDCDDGVGISSTISSSSRNTERYHHDFNDNELDRMMAISSNPVDVLDPDYGKCIVPVSSVINQQSDCIPVRGAIRIYLNTTGVIIDNDDNDDDDDDNDNNSTMAALKLSIESRFKRLIRFGMQRDLYVTIEEDDDDEAGNDDSRTNKNEVIVKQVSFIGTRIAFDNNDDKDNGTLVARGEEDDDGEKDSEETTENKNGDTTTTTTEKYDDGYNDYDGELSSSNLSDSTTISSNDTTNVTGLVLGSVGTVVFALLVAMLCSASRKQNSNNNNATEMENKNNNEEFVDQHVDERNDD
jgi:hypothetical protein